MRRPLDRLAVVSAEPVRVSVVLTPPLRLADQESAGLVDPTEPVVSPLDPTLDPSLARAVEPQPTRH